MAFRSLSLAALLLLSVTLSSANVAAVRRAQVPAPAPAPAQGPTPAPAPAPDPLMGNPVSIEWYQAHGWLMWLGFGMFMPLGIITSRHLQTITSMWFYTHIALMVLSISCIVAGGSIAFNKFEAIPGTPWDDPAYLHVTMGTAIFCLACFNFLFGLIRPHKGHSWRVIWYLTHMTFGSGAVVFSWYLIYTGMDIYDANWGVDTTALHNWFTVNISLLGFAYLLLGRWDHMLGQGDAESKVDGVTRFPSLVHVSSILGMNGGVASEERTAAEKKLEQERAEAYA